LVIQPVFDYLLAGGAKINVLLAEDEMLWGMIIQESLESKRFQTIGCVEDGKKPGHEYQRQA